MLVSRLKRKKKLPSGSALLRRWSGDWRRGDGVNRRSGEATGV
ncbi:hypothetical protein HanPI659440_Chr07g0273321 [Helianthus annuus]|nr:hypothetical protein HanPI659440_Chr07g0273321 [Helianthus annuus]